MVARHIPALLVFITLFSTSGSRFAAQENDTHIRVVVNLVQLNVAVTDNKGNYITGLRPQERIRAQAGRSLRAGQIS